MRGRHTIAFDVAAQLAAPVQLSAGDVTAGNTFERWRVQRAPLAPVDERLLLAYLVDRPDWSPLTARTTVQKLDRVFTAHSGRRLSSDAVATYIARMRATREHAPLELVPALRFDDARRIVTEADRLEVSADVSALRAGLLMLRGLTDLSLPLKTCWSRISGLVLESDADGVYLSLNDRGKRVAVPSQDADAWKQHLSVLNNRRRVYGLLRTAYGRAGLDPNTVAATLTEERWDQHWRALDPQIEKKIRNRAYLLVGTVTARRHAELARFTWDDVTVHPDGVSVRYQDNKHGRPVHYELTHPGTTQTPCPVECAACALEDLLIWQTECEGRRGGLVFATTYAGTTRAMSRQNGRLLIRSLTGLITDTPWGGTRSLRAGAATSWFERGLPIEQIARYITHHDSLHEARKYIRKTGSPGGTLQVPISGSPR